MPSDPPSDEALLARVGEGDEEALRALYARHAGLVFSIAARVAPAETAEDVVQEVFLTLWRKHETFDAGKGTFKAWLARIAKNRALNERRRRGTRGHDGDAALEGVADDALPADEAQWIAHRREVLRAAVDALPAPQRRAVSLAFFDELAHAEVATALGAPVGTVKTRIRLALKRLAPILAAALVVALVIVGWRWRRDDGRRAREERALRMVTASDVVPLRLSAQAGVPDAAHGSYRARPGERVAVLTTTALPALDGGDRYVGWVRHGAAWVSFGRLDVGSDSRSISVAEDDALATPPDEVRVTRESREGTAPEGPVVIAWSR
jgi:RNA polymerase sigma-70 factor (ECF subfamily)